MYIKNQLKKRLLISVVTVFLLVLTIIGSSYALFLDVKNDTNDQILSVGDLQITYLGGAAINIAGLTPMLDETAYQQTNNVYSFTIQNTGTVPYTFSINLENNEEYQGETLLNHNYIRYDLNDTGANLLGNKTNGKIFEYTLEAGQARLYNLRLWVADATIYNLPNEALGSKIHLSIVVTGKAGTLE